MKIVAKDNKAREKELAEKEAKSKEDKERTDYLDILKQDRFFNKYVIDGIIRKGINDLTDLSLIPDASLSDAKSLGELVIQAKMARKQLERMLSQLLN